MDLVALDVAIGLILVYLLLSFVVLALNEGLAMILHSRARTLKQGLARLLGGGDATVASNMVDELYELPLIAGLSERRIIPFTKTKAPSYIPANTFVVSLINVLSGQAAKTGEAPANPAGDLSDLQNTIQMSALSAPLKLQLLTLMADANGSVDKARHALVVWFDDGMERVSASYKARSQTIGVVFAFLVACVFNANTITIARSLAQNPAERA